MKLWPENPSTAEMVFVIVTAPIRIVIWMLVLAVKPNANERELLGRAKEP